MNKEIQNFLYNAVDETAQKIGIKKLEILHPERDFPLSWTWRKNFRNKSYADLVFALREEEYFKEGVVTIILARAGKNFPSEDYLSFCYFEKFWELETLINPKVRQYFKQELELNLAEGWKDAALAAEHITEILKRKKERRLQVIKEVERLGIKYIR